MEKTDFKGWKNSIRLRNEVAELIITTDIGPRVLHYALRGGQNAFHVEEDCAGRTGDPEFRSYGGHRLWHAPESQPRTYVPDNRPVQTEDTGRGIRLLPPPEGPTGIQKEWLVRLAPDSSNVHVIHRLTNIGLWPVRLAAWAISVMAPGGVGILPLPPRGSHANNLLPTGSLALWAYTDMADPRWQWGRQFVLLRQDPVQKEPQKIGLPAFDGWAGYASPASLFIKFFRHDASREYPDMGSSAELFTNQSMLEVESIGPLATLNPGAVLEHVEDWFLFEGIPLPRNDDDVHRNVIPRVKEAAAKLARPA
jgi:hypothetical protein